jgi:hypothetical protein
LVSNNNDGSPFTVCKWNTGTFHPGKTQPDRINKAGTRNLAGKCRVRQSFILGHRTFWKIIPNKCVSHEQQPETHLHINHVTLSINIAKILITRIIRSVEITNPGKTESCLPVAGVKKELVTLMRTNKWVIRKQLQTDEMFNGWIIN